MKKGYTLIELLGVIIILAILITLIFPSIINYIKSSNDTKDDLTIDLIMNAAELFVEDNSDDFINTSGKQYCLKLNTLIENNYLKGDLEYEGESLLGVKDLQLTYDNEFIFELVNSDECKTNELYIESLNINSPDLYNNTLTPVVYEENNWRVADIYSEWYSYKNQEWANAVILNSSVDKKVGDIVTVEGSNPDALAMFVWIPRYEYKIEGAYGRGGTSADLPGEIDVNFINDDAKITEGYRIHPAFYFGAQYLSGIWVGKFETSHNTLSSSITSNNLNCNNEECSNASGLRILPNVQSLRNNNVSSFFYAIKFMNKNENVFGLNSSITDSHMMKNSEWGAVAYLSQSRYGKYGNSIYVGEYKEIYQNKNSSFIAGNSNGTSSQGTTNTQCSYNDITDRKNGIGSCGGGASTTGNIYGIYDMSGGAAEFVMGVYSDSNGGIWSGGSKDSNSGFEGQYGYYGDSITGGLPWPNEKYYELYKEYNGWEINLAKACNYEVCYGHALSETEGWYGVETRVLSSSFPWFIRGGSIADGGVFSFASVYGNESSSISARVVLVPIALR